MWSWVRAHGYIVRWVPCSLYIILQKTIVLFHYHTTKIINGVSTVLLKLQSFIGDDDYLPPAETHTRLLPLSIKHIDENFQSGLNVPNTCWETTLVEICLRHDTQRDPKYVIIIPTTRMSLSLSDTLFLPSFSVDYLVRCIRNTTFADFQKYVGILRTYNPYVSPY